MPIVFIPSLGESLSIKVPVSPNRPASTPSSWLVRNDEQTVPGRQGTVEIKFAARLSSEEYRRLGDGKVQVWSDFPQAGGEGNVWGEVDFQLDSDADTGEGEVALTYTFSIPVPTASTSTFTFQPQSYSFTYRIVSSNGSIQWLGAYGQNGGVKVEFEEDYSSSSDADEALGLDLVGSCWGKQGRGSCMWFRTGDTNPVSKEEKVAISLARSEKWDVWGIGKDGYSVPTAQYATTSTPLSMVIFAPISSVESKPKVKDTWNPPFVRIDFPQAQAIPRSAIGFAASPEASLSLRNGEMYVSGAGTVIAQSFRDGNTAEWEKLVAHATSALTVSGSALPSPTSPPATLSSIGPISQSAFHPCKLAFATGDEKDIPVLVLPSSAKTCPVRLSVAPLVPVKEKGKARVNVDAAELMGQPQKTRFVLCRGKSIEFVDTKVTLVVGETVLLSPLYPFALSKSIAIAILTPHLPPSISPSESSKGSVSPSTSTQAEEILPTPPPSPHLKPIAHLTVKNIARLQQESGGGSGGLVGNDSSASISDIGVISSSVAAPVTATTAVSTNAASSRRVELARSISFISSASGSGSGANSDANANANGSGASSVSSRNKKKNGSVQKRPAGLVGCFRQFFLAASFWLLILVKRLVLGGGGRNSAAQRGRRGRAGSDSGFVNRWFGTAGSGLRSRSASASVSGHSTPTTRIEEVDERTPLLADPVIKAKTPAQVQESTTAEPESSATAKQTVSFNTTLLHSTDTNTNHTVVIYGLDAHAHAQKPQLQFEVDGASVVVVRLDQNQEGWNVVELDWKKGGNLSVSLGL
ncbi:hypothetical protein PQX77_016252 [Marasmius sp. AFHP31]|nr:hypothetical protein PQX77_016252 [Marasmius sp. AFHP31]